MYKLKVYSEEPPLPEKSFYNPELEDFALEIIQELKESHANVKETIGSIVGPRTVELPSGVHEISFLVT